MSMFGKDKDKEHAAGTAAVDADQDSTNVAPPLAPFSKKATHAAPAKPTAAAQPRPEIPRRVIDVLGGQRPTGRTSSVDDDANRLSVGKNICLSGEITSCQKLVVEGRVEASLTDAQIIEVMPSGYFKGTVEVDEADISGLFEGTLIARNKLTIRTTGRVNGKVRYGRIVIESGGEIAGDMASLEESAPGRQHAAPAGKS